MPKSRQSASDDDDLAIRMVALLKEDMVATQMKALFHPKELLAVISSLTAKVDHLTSQLALKDARIDGLEQRLAKLEIDSDSQEQSSRRPNFRIQGLPEQGDGTTDDKGVVRHQRHHGSNAAAGIDGHREIAPAGAEDRQGGTAAHTSDDHPF